MTVMCNVAWPCDLPASAAMKVYATMPRFGCSEHRRIIKGEWRDGLEPWVVPAITDPSIVQGRIKMPEEKK